MEIDPAPPHSSGIASDEELMQRVVAGEQGALSQLYGRHRPLLCKIIDQLVSDTFDTEEVLQDVFITVWNRARSYDEARGKLLGWMVRVARRRAIDHLRRNWRYRTRRCSLGEHGDEELAEEHAQLPPTPAQADSRSGPDLRTHLDDLMARLPCEQQRVLQLAYYDSLSQRQIAAQTGIPLGTIKTRLDLAIRKLLRLSEHLRQELI